MEKETVTKLDVVKRQLNEAVRLFFEQRDLISIHTLAAAAGQVLCDLLKKRGRGMSFRDEKMIKPEYQAEWHQALRASENFFKHADRDRCADHDFSPGEVEINLFDVTEMYISLTGRLTYEAFIFKKWFVFKNPHLLVDGELKNMLLDQTKRLELGIHINDLEAGRQAIQSMHELPPSISQLFD